LKFEWYTEFVDTEYTPKPSDLIVKFRVQPAQGITMEEAAGRVASESSVGTWTTLTTMKPEIKRLMAKAYKISGNIVEIAYPVELFELGNMPQILSSIAGNIFGMKAVERLRLLDIKWPKEIIESFKGPQYGIDGVREMVKVYDRPLTASVLKPKIGFTAEGHAKAGYEAWIGGIDMLKDDENLSSQKFNRFEERAEKCFKMRDKAEAETGEKKIYLINITAETKEMLRRARLVKSLGGEFVMVDILTTGWAAVQTVREECEDLKLAIHAHRAFHAAFTRDKTHGMSMLAVAKVARLIGVDQLHIGTVVGKLESPLEEVKAIRHSLIEDLDHIKKTFPVSSGGLHPGLLPEVMRIFGVDFVVQVGGGVWGHPWGGKAGAMAVRQAIEATLKGISLDEYAKEKPELREALKKWGYVKPR